MLSYLADEDFNGAILRELRRRLSNLDVERIQDVQRSGDADPDNLEYAASQNRILLTHDKHLIQFAINRVEAGVRMPGVFIVHQAASMGQVLDDLMDLTRYSLDNEWDNQILFIPLAM